MSMPGMLQAPNPCFRHIRDLGQYPAIADLFPPSDKGSRITGWGWRSTTAQQWRRRDSRCVIWRSGHPATNYGANRLVPWCLGIVVQNGPNLLSEIVG
jgi:hypothetical protein